MPGYELEYFWSPGGGAPREAIEAADDDAAKLKAAFRFAALDPGARVVGYLLRNAEGRVVFTYPQRGA
ncbi:MAG: hypothetical protein JNK30_16530 [Phenylobacterium sp.]|uniref:hypothetical protein n=1 Tax=Phenylobacterium sp. TaxID=1871053 RepID=UPI001A53B1DF|nr:hypothetical protein [Phenylobacterium sp.]MBL8772990.1 hypothetical protein [Phenylobacterium sp.]